MISDIDDALPGGVAPYVVAVIIVAGLTSLALYEPPERPSSTTETREPTSYTSLNDTEKLAWLDVEQEQRINNQWYDRALNYGRTSYCDKIRDETLSDTCRAEVEARAEYGLTESSLEPLQGASTNDKRRFYYAVDQGEKALCDEIADTDLRSFCYDETT